MTSRLVTGTQPAGMSGPWLPTPFRPAGALTALAVFTIAVAARIPYLGHVPHKDELNHVLAARSLLSNGTLEILPGALPYDRAWGFTHLVAAMFRMFGESLEVARIPAVVAAAILATLLFSWVRAEAGRVGAWFATLLFIFSPISLQLSQWVRFYTLHALFFFGACMLVFRLLSSPRPGRRGSVVLVLGAFTLLVAALHLQDITLVGLAGLLTWVALVGVPDLWRRLPTRRARFAAVAAIIGATVAALVVAVASGFAAGIVEMAAYADDWAEANRGNIRFFHYILVGQYPTLWTLFPVAAFVALAARPRAALLCLCVFGVPFAAHSLLAWKAERYLFYALPWFFALWGIAVGAALPWLRQQVGRALVAVAGEGSPRRREVIVTALLLLAVLFAAFGNPATSYSVKVMTRSDAEWEGHWGNYRGNPDWVGTARTLGSEVQEAGAVLASYDVTAVYALGRLDYFLREPGHEEGQRLEFRMRGKTGVPTVAAPESIARIMGCHTTGLVFIERGHLRKDWAVPDETVDFLDARAELLDTPDPMLIVYRWETPLAAMANGSCENILQPVTMTSRGSAPRRPDPA